MKPKAVLDAQLRGDSATLRYLGSKGGKATAEIRRKEREQREILAARSEEIHNREMWERIVAANEHIYRVL